MTTHKKFTPEENQRVSEFWAKSHSSKPDIYNFAPARNYFYNQVNGSKGLMAGPDWFEEWFLKHYLKDKAPVNKCLSLCSGDGARDRRIARLGFFTSCLSIDISGGAIRKAEQAAHESGITNISYEVGDLNVLTLKPAEYDLVYVGAGMHHILNLEHAVGQIYESLKPGGYFVCDEYVGPAYSNLSPRHREIINSAIHLIPRRLRYASESNFVPVCFRRSPLLAGLYLLTKLGRIDPEALSASPDWPAYRRRALDFLKYASNIMKKIRGRNDYSRFGKLFDISPDNIRRGDPTEGVRADEIIPIIKQHFSETNVHYYNGSILCYALDEKFFTNYEATSQNDRTIFDFLVNMEIAMIECGEIPPIHAAIVSRR
jgi:SAM-dependent methyltransferase